MEYNVAHGKLWKVQMTVDLPTLSDRVFRLKRYSQDYVNQTITCSPEYDLKGRGNLVVAIIDDIVHESNDMISCNNNSV